MDLRKIKRISLIFVIITLILNLNASALANDEITESVKETYNLKDTVNLLENYTDGLDLNEITDSLIKGEGLDTSNLMDVIMNLFFKEVRKEMKTFVKILIVIILFAIIKCFELENS